MRPKPATPIVHDGVRYEATHWSALAEQPSQPARPPVVDEELMRRVASVMQRDAMTRLQTMFSKPELDEDVDHLAGMEKVLRADGSFSEQEVATAIDTYRSVLGEPAVFPTKGGYIRAFDVATDEELWRLMVYRSEESDGGTHQSEDVLITNLAIDEAHLVARDELCRVHRIDLKQRAVIDVVVDTTPTPLDLARIALRALPSPRREKLWERVSAVKTALDIHNVDSSPLAGLLGGLPSGGGPEMEAMLKQAMEMLPQLGDVRGQMAGMMDELKTAMAQMHGAQAPNAPPPDLGRDLELLLEELGSLAHVDALIGDAHVAGLRKQQAIAAGEDPHVLYDWFQGELSWIAEDLASAYWGR